MVGNTDILREIRMKTSLVNCKETIRFLAINFNFHYIVGKKRGSLYYNYKDKERELTRVSCFL